MKHIYSFHREESRRTKKLLELIVAFPNEPTDLDTGNVNVFTLVWAFIKDENYRKLVNAKTSDQLRGVLESNTILILKGKRQQILLNLDTYVSLKTNFNRFYKYIHQIASFYVQNRLYIDKEKTMKALKDKDMSLPFLLRQEQLSFKLQRMVILPKVMVKGAFEIERPQLSFEDKKVLDEFVLFVTQDISVKGEVAKQFQSSMASFGSFVQRRKEVVLGMLILSFVLGVFVLPGSFLYTNLFSQHTMEQSTAVMIQNVKYDVTGQRLVFDIMNHKDHSIVVQQVVTNKGTTLWSGDVLIPSENQLTFDVQLSTENLLLDNMKIIVSGLDANQNPFTTFFILPRS